MALLDMILPPSRIRASRGARASLAQRLSIWRTRRDLATLDEDALRDIGVTREAARREAQRAFWDAPTTWINR